MSRRGSRTQPNRGKRDRIARLRERNRADKSSEVRQHSRWESSEYAQSEEGQRRYRERQAQVAQ